MALVGFLGLLGEVISQFIEEAPPPGADLLVFDLRELPEQLLLPGGEVLGGLDHDLDQLVAAAPAADVGHPPRPDPQDLAALGPAGHVQVFGAVERGDFDLGAEGRLGEADGHLAPEVVPLPLEEGMLLDHDLDPQVAARGAEVAELALVAELQPHAALHARGDVDLELGRRRRPARPPTGGAGVGDPDPLTPASGAGGGDLEEAPGLDDLAPAAAVVAGRGDGPLLGPRAAAFGA